MTDDPQGADWVSGRGGRRLISLPGLLERAEVQFWAEHGQTTAEATPERLKLVRDVVEYVLAVESADVDAAQKADLIRQVYSAIYGYGPLDALFLDDSITTIALESPEKASVRRGHGDLTPVGPLFSDMAQMRRILRRLIVDAGADLTEDQPFIETGLTVAHRPISISLMGPPVATSFHADIRLHPRQPRTLDDLVGDGLMDALAVDVLRALARSAHGVVIVGDTESGKTTLLGALAAHLPDPARMVSVERAGELRLPTGARRLVPRWPGSPESEQSFGACILDALVLEPACLLLDEVRADEPEMIAPLLRDDHAPRQLWAFRGPYDTKRLRSALGLLARRADMSAGDVLAGALYARLPFVVTLRRAAGRLVLYSIAEWQVRDDPLYPDYAVLMGRTEDRLALTGKRPARPLALPDSFWG